MNLNHLKPPKRIFSVPMRFRSSLLLTIAISALFSASLIRPGTCQPDGGSQSENHAGESTNAENSQRTESDRVQTGRPAEHAGKQGVSENAATSSSTSQKIPSQGNSGDLEKGSGKDSKGESGDDGDWK